jgi:predicted Zn-dependent protease
MEVAAKLAPEDLDLRSAAGIARLEAQVKTGKDASATLRGLRNLVLPPEREIEIRLRMAEILNHAGLNGEAATDLESATQLAPHRADLLFDLALARFRIGQWDAALNSAERAKALEDSGSLESLMGDIQEHRGEALAAVHSYQAAVALEPLEERHRLALGLELLRHQTFDAALVVLEQAEAMFPRSVRVKILLSLTYYFADRSIDSIRALLEATRLEPKNAKVNRYLGEISLLDTAIPDTTAVAQVCKYADQEPKDRSADAFCGSTLLRLAQEGGDASRKPEIFRRLQHAVRIAPDDAVARCHFGKALEWTNDWQGARAQMEACVRLQPDSPEWHYHLSRVYRRLGLTGLASQQTLLQKQTAERQSEESFRRTNTVKKFLFLLEH